ncbi:MAG: hypothetical protein QOK46_685 [Microbacteriaceae bacterium]|nr:hypothetical protein [Microbacteriaceae bacterium]
MLPKLVRILAAGEKPLLTYLLDSGAVNPILQQGDASRYAMTITPPFCVALAMQSIGGDLPVAPAARADIVARSWAVAELAPVPIDAERLAQMAEQLTGGRNSSGSFVLPTWTLGPS